MRAFSRAFPMAKVEAVGIRPGNLLEWDKRVWRVLKSYHVHVGGRGGAFMQVEMKDIETGTKTNQRFRTEDKVERAFVDPRDMQYLYQDGDMYVFMDKENYEQLSLPAEFLEGQAGYLLPNTDVQINFYNGRAIASSCRLPWASRSRTRSPGSRTPPPPTPSSRPRWKPASRCRSRPSSTRARRSRSTPPKASTWSARSESSVLRALRCDLEHHLDRHHVPAGKRSAGDERGVPLSSGVAPHLRLVPDPQ